MSRIALVLAALLTAPMSANATSAQANEDAPPQERELSDFEGTYTFSGGQSQRDAIVEEIERATEDLNPIIRAIARKRIGESLDPSSTMRIKVEGDHVSISRSGDKPTFAATINTGTFKFGGKYTGRIHWRDGKLKAVITGGGSRTTVRYSLDETGKRLTVRTKIQHEMIPLPVQVKKTFAAW